MFRSTFAARRVLLALCALLLSLVFILPRQSQTVLQAVGQPLTDVIAFPVQAIAALDRHREGVWDDYVALRRVREENQQLQREIEFLRGQVSDLRELAASSQRLGALFQFREQTPSRTVAARVIARDSTNWYRSIVLDKGEQDGVQVEMGVITLTGAVGRVVKTSASTSVVLLVTDPNNAVTGLVQRTRDEGIIEGTLKGGARMKYIPLLSIVRVGDPVVTSGLTGGFPKGVPIGTITSIAKDEGELFQSAEVLPEVDFSKLEEVLIIAVPRPGTDGAPGPPAGSKP